MLRNIFTESNPCRQEKPSGFFISCIPTHSPHNRRSSLQYQQHPPAALLRNGSRPKEARSTICHYSFRSAGHNLRFVDRFPGLLSPGITYPSRVRTRHLHCDLGVGGMWRRVSQCHSYVIIVQRAINPFALWSWHCAVRIYPLM